MEFTKLAAQYQEALFRTVIPFWSQHSRDPLCGGYFNSLTAEGEVFDTDKVIHLQAQQVWTLAWLYNQVDAVPAWLELAQHGADFLLQHGRQANGRWLAQVDRRGRAVQAASTVVPDGWAAMAFAELYRATGAEEFASVGQQTALQILAHRQQQRTDWEAELGGFRTYRHLSEPTMVLKMLLETTDLLEPELYKQALEAVVIEIQNEFFDRRLHVLRENVLPEGAFCDSALGRRLQPGYVFETATYLLELAERTGNRRLAQQAVQMAVHLAELSWDEPFGGFLQYVDLKERPSVETEWDRKLAWVHARALAVFAKGYGYTRQTDCLKWFRRVHEYAWSHFPDKANSEWFAALDRRGQPLISCKATPTKGCCLIRNLHDAWTALDKAQQQPVQPWR